MHREIDVVIVGGGQAGLAVGYELAQRGVPFVIVEAAPRIGASWRTRYDSLRLFTPAQYNSLPGMAFPTPTDTYPTKDDVAAYLGRYADAFQLPVQLGTRVQSVRRIEQGYVVETATATYRAHAVVVATGPFQQPYVPALTTTVAPDVVQLHSSSYRNPQQLPSGAVLVVGAGNSGAQIADELSRERHVVLSIGKQPPVLPQRMLGKDVFWWLHALRLMDVTVESRLGKRMRVMDPLIGTDLRHLERAHAVRLVGRTVRAVGDTITFADGQACHPRSIIWATGFRPDYQWIDVPVFDDAGRPIHRRGVTSAPGLYFIGMPWQYRRGSALLGGVGRDAVFLAAAIAQRTRSQHTAISRTTTARPHA